MEKKVLQFTQRERRKVSALLVEPDNSARITMRQAMTALGFGTVSDAPSHLQALDKLKERPFSHILFDARETNMSPVTFLREALDLDSRLITLVCSANPVVDEVFELLMEGARGYIVKPPTGDSLEEAVVMATKGEIIPDVILYAADRNQALASMVATALDKVSTLRRQATRYETARIELEKAELGLMRATELARTFAKGGDEEFRQAIIHVCIDRGNGPASRLGRVRRLLHKRKVPDTNG